MKYYELREDIYYPKRWYLGDILEITDNWELIYGKKTDEKLFIKELHIKLYKDGTPMDYTTNEAYSVPIVSERIKKQLGFVNGLQFIQVTIENKKLDLKYFIMVVTNKIDCVNEELSVFGKFMENDPVRPDLAGHYSWFTTLIIDPAKINGADVFRINKSENKLIISERLKRAIETVDVSGIKFIEV